jgi:nucleoside-diphosphate-sugar epimerase
MARVLVTGGFGLVGRWAVPELVRCGHAVTVFEQDSAPHRRRAASLPGVTTRFGDLRDAAAVAAAVAGHDYVLHMGCVLPPRAEEEPDLARAVNVGGTSNVLAACRAAPRPPRLVHVSSGEVYGATRHLAPPRRVGDARVAVNHYSSHKIAAEELVETSGLDHVIVRLSAVIDIALGSYHPLMFEFPCDVRMEVLHAADAARALAACLETEAVWGRGAVLPVAGGERCRTTYGAFVNRMLETLGVGALPEAAFTREDYPSDWHDTDESQALLKYQRHGLDDICHEVRALLGWRRHFVPLARPFVRRSILSRSPYLRAGG